MEMDQIEIEERPDQDQRHTLVAKGYNVIWLLIVILVGFIGYLATDKSVAREEGIEAVDKPPKLYIVTAANMLQHPASKDIQTIENLNVSTSVYGGVHIDHVISTAAASLAARIGGAKLEVHKTLFVHVVPVVVFFLH